MYRKSRKIVKKIYWGKKTKNLWKKDQEKKMEKRSQKKDRVLTIFINIFYWIG